jgi:hypothetical protein
MAALSAQTALSGVTVTARVQKTAAKRSAVVIRAGKYDDELLETAVSERKTLTNLSGFLHFIFH